MLGAVNPKPSPNPGPTQAELCWAPWVAPTVELDARCDDGQAELTLTPTLPLPPTLILTRALTRCDDGQTKCLALASLVQAEEAEGQAARVRVRVRVRVWVRVRGRVRGRNRPA